MKSSVLLALFAAPGLLASCAKDQEFPIPQPATEQGYVRVVNNLATRPGGQVTQGPVQLMINGNNIGPAATTGAAAPYQALTVGELFVQIQLPNASGGNWVQIDKLPLAKNQRYSLFTYSALASQSAKVVAEPAMLPAAVAGKAHLRVLNVAAESTLARIAEPQATAPLYPEVAWGSMTSYQAVDARTYTLQTSRADGNQAQLFTQSIALAPGKAYTLVLRGSSYSDAVAPERLAFDLVIDE